MTGNEKAIELAHWLQWWQDDLPCIYTKEQAFENAKFLIDMLGGDWLSQARLYDKEHPIKADWVQNGAEKFLNLNSLAEDIRILKDVENFSQVLLKLKSENEYFPTLLVIRSAAMFKRSGTNVCYFYDETGGSVPDFLIKQPDQSVAVECKQLTTSEIEKNFNKYAKDLYEKIEDEVFRAGKVYPHIFIIIKNPSYLPYKTDVVGILKTIPDNISRNVEYRGRHFNIFLYVQNSGLLTVRNVLIASPKSDDENERFLRVIRSGSKQVKAVACENFAGALVLGLTQHQDYRPIAKTIQSQFRQNRFRSLSGVLLHEFGVFTFPPVYSVYDKVGSIINENAHHGFPEFFNLKEAGEVYNYDMVPIAEDTVTAYIYQESQATFTAPESDVNDFEIAMNVPSINELKPELFR